jgi:hypothetical protein
MSAEEATTNDMNQPRACHANGKAVGAGLPKTNGGHTMIPNAPGARCGVTGFNVCLAEFWSDPYLLFLCSSLFECKCLFCVSWEHVNSFLIFTELRCKSLP